MSLGANGDAAVVADPDAGLLAPDKRPPWAGRSGPENGSLFGDGLEPGGGRRGAEFAVVFVLIDVGQQLIQQLVGTGQFADIVGGQKGWQAFLPAIMAAFDLPLAWGVGA